MPSSRDQRPKAALPASLSDDAFLDGRVRLLQPRNGFRAGLDSVVLAAAVPARPRQRVCDVGVGVGAAALCLAARVPQLHITGVEIDEDVATIAGENAARNDQAQTFEVIVADVLKRPRTIQRQYFDHVITNPPFHDTARGTRAPLAAKARATSAAHDELSLWLRFARAVAKPAGWLTMIVPPEQLAVAIAALSPRGLGVEIVPLLPKRDAAAKRVIIRVRMNSRAGLVLHPGVVLHEADGTPTPAAQAVLRRGEALIR